MTWNSSGPATSGGASCTIGSPRSSVRQIEAGVVEARGEEAAERRSRSSFGNVSLVA